MGTCTNRLTPAARAASSSMWVPSTLVARKLPASKNERSTCDSAAKWTTAVCPYISPATRSASRMLPSAKASFGDRKASPRFSRLPA